MNLRERITGRVLHPLYLRREGIDYRPHLDALRRSQWLPREEILALQWERVRDMAAHAYAHTVFYRERFDAAGLRPEDIRSPEDLRRLPPLEKTDIAAGPEALLADDVPASRRHRRTTGGTTGVRILFQRDDACLGPKMAASFRHEGWAGWEPGQPMALVWPARQDYVGYHTLRARLVNALVHRQVVLPGARLEPPALDAFLGRLTRERPVMIKGFPGPLDALARRALERGLRVPAPRGVITTGEPCLPGLRRRLEEAFSAPVFDNFSSRETGMIASQCEQGGGLHVNAESLYLEFERDGRPVAPGEPGEILVTDLWNRGMPFLRYRLGDLAVPSEASCPCGRGLPLLDGVTGRVGDTLIAPGGALVAQGSLVLYLVDNGPAVERLQVVQDEADHLTLRAVRGEASDDALRGHYRAVIADLFGLAMRFDLEFTDRIDPEPSGKVRFAVNRVAASSGDRG